MTSLHQMDRLVVLGKLRVEQINRLDAGPAVTYSCGCVGTYATWVMDHRPWSNPCRNCAERRP